MPSIRQTVAKKLLEFAQNDSKVIALTADLSSSVGFDPIKESIPSQFIQCGIAEQEMLSLSAGMALSGSKPFAASYAQFHPGRNWDQLRTSVCYNHAPVRLISSHYGLNVGGDGATHQNLEYLSLTLPLPNLRIFLPFNSASATWSITQMYQENSVGSILFQPRESHTIEIDDVDISQLENNGFIYKKTEKHPSKNLIITGGLIASESYKIKEKNVDYIFLVELTRINSKHLVEILKHYKNIIVVEEHQQFGGLGSLIQLIANSESIPLVFHHVAVNKSFGKSSLDYNDLYRKFNLSAEFIEQKLI